jgi:hypothetical protein
MDAANIGIAAQRAMRLPPSCREALIRTLSVSLVAVAAIVASLAVVRQRQEEPARGRERRAEPSPAAVDLDQLRNAGL